MNTSPAQTLPARIRESLFTDSNYSVELNSRFPHFIRHRTGDVLCSHHRS